MLARLLRDIQPGDTLVVARLDRLARSVGHLLAVIEQLEMGGAHFRFSRDSISGAPLICWRNAPRPASAAKAKEVTVLANPTEPPLCPAVVFDAWLRHRTQASDLDGSAAEGSRQERPLCCAMTKAGRYSRRFLRAGLATVTAGAGAPSPNLMRQARHKNTQFASIRVAPAYFRSADLMVQQHHRMGVQARQNGIDERARKISGPPTARALIGEGRRASIQCAQHCWTSVAVCRDVIYAV